jgi:outer membrane protein OmpA-like peptidoglycan-associated protein
LSLRRANAAKAYLQKQGIAASRIKVSQFGEDDPIAKNELAGGRDTEEGRQLNRRVDLLVIDANGTVLNGIKEEINVPSDLKN